MSGRFRRVIDVARRALSSTLAGVIAPSGTSASQSVAPAVRADFAADPVLGPNVLVFDPGMAAADVQAKLDEVFAAQERNQFGEARYAILFRPGRYEVDVDVGFYEQVLGLGAHPDDVRIEGRVQVAADWFDGNATQNFWRGAENLAVAPPSGTDVWAAAQAAPLRRVHVCGDLRLDDGGWSSGGYLADSVVDGQVRSGSQQQWLSRNTRWGGWRGQNWNMVFVGAQNAPADSFPDPPYSTVATTPVIREKPTLVVDDTGGYRVLLPALRRDSRGPTWTDGAASPPSLPLADFLVATPKNSAAELNAALAAGRHVVFTPGVYRLTEPLRVTRADTVLLGLGLATLRPVTGDAALVVADVPGVRVAGLLLDAGEQRSPVLMRVGENRADTEADTGADFADNPISLHDLFFRIGGTVAGRAGDSLVVNSPHVLGDHLWLWRADHGDAGTVGWDNNPADTGLVVNGHDVTMYGLFVEHYQKHQVCWNGERGRTYFFQNELPYDPPDQAAWMNGNTRGFAAYKVGDAVREHRLLGAGSYCFFNVDPTVVAECSFEAPATAGVVLRGLVTVSLGGVGTIAHVVNDTGGPSDPAAHVATVTAYP